METEANSEVNRDELILKQQRQIEQEVCQSYINTFLEHCECIGMFDGTVLSREEKI